VQPVIAFKIFVTYLWSRYHYIDQFTDVLTAMGKIEYDGKGQINLIKVVKYVQGALNSQTTRISFSSRGWGEGGAYIVDVKTNTRVANTNTRRYFSAFPMSKAPKQSMHTQSAYLFVLFLASLNTKYTIGFFFMM